MPTYTLDLDITPQDLDVIQRAGQRIVLAKPVGGGKPNVAWVSFDPFQHNEVTWTEEFGMYASTTEKQHGASISKMSESPFPAADGTSYTFSSSANFEGPRTETSVSKGVYKVENEMPSSRYPSLQFGLLQEAKVNNQNAGLQPLNIASVPAENSATFTPITTVYAWLEADIESGTVITEVTSERAKVQFKGGTTSHTLQYDATKGKFVAKSN
jgi:hypothetical protein